MKTIIKKDLDSLQKTPNLLDYKKTYAAFSWKDAAQNIDYFSDDTLNAAYNIIDRHTKGKNKHKPALHFKSAKGGKVYTFNDLKVLSSKFANVLKESSIKKGDRVFIFLPTIPERYIAFIGILRCGAIVGTLFSAFQEMALRDRLNDSKAKMIITNAELYPRISNIWQDVPTLEKVILIDNDATNKAENERIVMYEQAMELAPDTYATEHLNPTDPAYILYTSGTTGKPKGVVHSHSDVLQAMMTAKYVLDLQENDIYWCTADIGWVTGVVYGILGPWALGVTQVIYEGKFSPVAWYSILEREKVTVWYTAPTAIRMLMGAGISPKTYNLTSLRHLCSVGEPLNPEAIWWGLEQFGLPFHDTWWQTELGGISITNFPCLDIKPGSMGKPFPGIYAAIIDDAGNEVPDGEEGNLALKKQTVSSLMKGIWENKEKYDSYFMGDWYLSGDRAYKDKDGYFWFVGRADDLINTMGERVGPFEVESALVEHKVVIEAGVIGKHDPIRGEIIKAFVVIHESVEGTEALKKELQAFVKKTLAGHAYPREIEFIDKLPKTRSGKIVRRLLRAKENGLPLGDTSTLESY